MKKPVKIHQVFQLFGQHLIPIKSIRGPKVAQRPQTKRPVREKSKKLSDKLN